MPLIFQSRIRIGFHLLGEVIDANEKVCFLFPYFFQIRLNLSIVVEQSLRLIVHTSIGGEKVRIKISNTFGDQPLLIGGVRVPQPSETYSTADRNYSAGG